MERERAIHRNVRNILCNVRDILRSVIIIMALIIPCIVILVVKALLWLVKKFYAYVQRELELFHELYEDSNAPVWDKEGLFEDFIKGEDVQSIRQTRNSLKPKAEKRPTMLEQFIKDIIHQKPCAPLWVYTNITGKSALARDERIHGCAKIDASVTNSATGVNQLREENGRKYNSPETTVSSLCANREVYCQATCTNSDVTSNGVTSVIYAHVTVHSENIADKRANTHQEIGRSSLLVDKRKKESKAAPIAGCTDQVGADRNVASQATERSTSSVNKMKKRDKAKGVSCSNQVSADTKVAEQTTERSTSSVHIEKSRDKAKSNGFSNQVGADKNVTSKATMRSTDKKVTSQATERSTFSVNKEKNSDKPNNVRCCSQVGADKNVTSQAFERSGSSVNKRRKRANAKRDFNQRVESEHSAKKQRKEPAFTEQYRRAEIPVPSSFRKKTKEKKSKKAAHEPAKVTKRKLLKVEMRPGTPSKGQLVLTKAKQEPVANAIPYRAPLDVNVTPQMGAGQEPIAVQNVLGELVNAKRPLPVTPFTVQPAEDMNEGPLSATPSITELARQMEKLQIDPDVSHDSDSVDESNGDYELYDSDGDCVLCECDDRDDGDGEYAVFPELKSLPKQVLQLIQLLP